MICWPHKRVSKSCTKSWRPCISLQTRASLHLCLTSISLSLVLSIWRTFAVLFVFTRFLSPLSQVHWSTARVSMSSSAAGKRNARTNARRGFGERTPRQRCFDHCFSFRCSCRCSFQRHQHQLQLAARAAATGRRPDSRTTRQIPRLVLLHLSSLFVCFCACVRIFNGSASSLRA